MANNLIQQYLGDVGITVEYTTVPIANVIADVLAPKFSASYFTLQEDVDAFQASTFLLTSGATFNPYKVEDPKVEELTRAIQTGDEAEATAAAKELNRYVVENALHAPFYRQANSFGFSADLTAQPQAGNAYPYLYNIKPKA